MWNSFQRLLNQAWIVTLHDFFLLIDLDYQKSMKLCILYCNLQECLMQRSVINAMKEKSLSPTSNLWNERKFRTIIRVQQCWTPDQNMHKKLLVYVEANEEGQGVLSIFHIWNAVGLLRNSYHQIQSITRNYRNDLNV